MSKIKSMVNVTKEVWGEREYWKRPGYFNMHRLRDKFSGFQLLIDVVDACSVRCPTCPTGTLTSRDGHKMDIDTFRRVLDKAQAECKLQKVQLYRWSDPLLHPQIHLFAQECFNRGLHVSTSSVLQHTNCDFEKLLSVGLTEFRVSFSGWMGMRYTQRGATPEKFIAKLDAISKYPKHPSTKLVFFFHLYEHSITEMARAKELATKYGYEFYAFPATHMNYDHTIEGYTEEDDPDILRMLLETPEENIARFKKKPTKDDYCFMQEKEITLDSYARMQQCQMMYSSKYIRGDFLTTPLKDLRRSIMNNPLCLKCKACGIPKYAMIFADPAVVKEPIVHADEDKYVNGQPPEWEGRV